MGRTEKIYFDNYSHTSGHLRAFVQCRVHKHQCRLYRFMKDFGSELECKVFLLAWLQAGRRNEDANARDWHVYSCLPSSEDLDAVRAELAT